jgi:uncharacterized phage protein (TIGR01671 family)
MLRETKFRGQRVDNKEWVEGYYGWSMGKHYITVVAGSPPTWNNPGGDYFEKSYEVIPETVGQWSGLADKNNKDIWEGDILRSFSSSVPAYEVFYDRGCYRLRYKLKSSNFYDWGPFFRMEEISKERESKMYSEVIGNIHQHPELLTPQP